MQITYVPAPGLIRRARVPSPVSSARTIEVWVDSDGHALHPLTRLRGADGVHSASAWLESEHDALEVVAVSP